MSARPYRWTPSRIRKATPFPKPIATLSRLEKAFYAATTDTSWILKHIARHADIIHDGRDINEVGFTDPFGGPASAGRNRFDHNGGNWLLIPVSTLILDALAEIGSATEDFEHNGDAEPDVDDEPSLGSLDKRVNQTMWGGGTDFHFVDAELDDNDDEDNGDHEPDEHLGEAFYRRPRVPVIPAEAD